MNTNDTLEKRLGRLGERLARQSPVVDRVMASIDRCETVPSSKTMPRRILVMMMKPQNLVAAAAVLALVFFGIRPLAVDGKKGQIEWWLAPPVAWAGELSAAIDQASTKGFTTREQSVHVMKDGSRSTSSTSSVLFVMRDRYRRDIYDEGRLRETQWYVQSEDGLTMTSVRFRQKNFTVTHDPQPRPAAVDPVMRMGALAAKLDEAGRSLGTDRVEGQEAVEFEIAATKIDIHANEATIHVWLDKATKMPLRITYEFAAQSDPQSQLTATILVQDRFDWNPELPADTFTPRIPEGWAKADSD